MVRPPDREPYHTAFVNTTRKLSGNLFKVPPRVQMFMGGIAPAVYLTTALCVVWFIVANHDHLPTIMILTPVLLPAIKAAGIDPAYLGVTFILVTVMGLLTPPVGTVLNVACSAGGINMERMRVVSGYR